MAVGIHHLNTRNKCFVVSVGQFLCLLDSGGIHLFYLFLICRMDLGLVSLVILDTDNWVQHES